MEPEKIKRFEQLFWPHLQVAYNLARWLARRESDADDIIQESCLRAVKSFDQYRGGDARAWFLAIVRNTSYTWLRQNRTHELSGDPDTILEQLPETGDNPETQASQIANQELLRRALEGLPLEFREILVLRELEGLSYKEICEVSGLPIGTVMSRLSRGRDRLANSLRESPHEL